MLVALYVLVYLEALCAFFLVYNILTYQKKKSIYTSYFVIYVCAKVPD
jgi:hypothetical protein